MITRTIGKNFVEFDAYSIELKKVERFSLDVAEKVDADNALKVVTKMCKSSKYVPVEIIKVGTKVSMYGMTEEDFIKYGTKLDPKTRKPLE